MSRPPLSPDERTLRGISSSECKEDWHPFPHMKDTSAAGRTGEKQKPPLLSCALPWGHCREWLRVQSTPQPPSPSHLPDRNPESSLARAPGGKHANAIQKQGSLLSPQLFILFLPVASLVPQLIKELACQCRRPGFDPWVRKIPWRRKWQPTPVFLPEKSHGERTLEDCSLGGCKSQTKLRD